MLNFPFQQTFYFTLKCNIAVQNIVKNAIDSSSSHVLGINFYLILSSEINAYQKQIKMISITSEMI